jgi:hypothetical protein
MNTNRYIIKHELSLLNKQDFEKFDTEYEYFYSKNIEEYQKCYQSKSYIDYKCILLVSYKFDELENSLILKHFGKEKYYIFLNKKIKRRAEYYAYLEQIVYE